MSRARKVCSQHGCPNLQPCPLHTPEPWAGSTRRERVRHPGRRDTERRKRILRRDNYVCHVCGQAGADQADHVIPLSQGGADHESNMAAIHERPCHAAKTQREAAAARGATP